MPLNLEQAALPPSLPETGTIPAFFDLPVRVGFSFEVLRHLNCVRLGIIGVCPNGSECFGARGLEAYEAGLERTAAETIRTYLLGVNVDAPPLVAVPSREAPLREAPLQEAPLREVP